VNRLSGLVNQINLMHDTRVLAERAATSAEKNQSEKLFSSLERSGKLTLGDKCPRGPEATERAVAGAEKF